MRDEVLRIDGELPGSPDPAHLVVRRLNDGGASAKEHTRPRSVQDRRAVARGRAHSGASSTPEQLAKEIRSSAVCVTSTRTTASASCILHEEELIALVPSDDAALLGLDRIGSAGAPERPERKEEDGADPRPASMCTDTHAAGCTAARVPVGPEHDAARSSLITADARRGSQRLFNDSLNNSCDCKRFGERPRSVHRQRDHIYRRPIRGLCDVRLHAMAPICMAAGVPRVTAHGMPGDAADRRAQGSSRLVSEDPDGELREYFIQNASVSPFSMCNSPWISEACGVARRIALRCVLALGLARVRRCNGRTGRRCGGNGRRHWRGSAGARGGGSGGNAATGRSGRAGRRAAAAPARVARPREAWVAPPVAPPEGRPARARPAEEERAEEERAEEERAEQERAEQERAEQERAEQEQAEQERAEQERAEQERAEQERAEEGAAEQARAGRQEAATPAPAAPASEGAAAPPPTPAAASSCRTQSQPAFRTRRRTTPAWPASSPTR